MPVTRRMTPCSRSGVLGNVSWGGEEVNPIGPGRLPNEVARGGRRRRRVVHLAGGPNVEWWDTGRTGITWLVGMFLVNHAFSFVEQL